MNWRTRILGVALGAMSGALMAQQATSAPSTATTSGRQIVTGSVVSYSPGQSIVLRSADGKTATYPIGPSVSAPAGVEIGRVVTLSTESASGSQPVVIGIMVKESNPADTTAPSAWSGSASGATGQFSSSDVSSPAPMPAPSGSSGQSTSSGSSSSSGAAGQSSGSGQSSDVPPTSGSSGATSSSRQTTTTQTETSRSAASISGRVTAYEPKQSITIEQPGKGAVTYTIDAQSDLPRDVAVGKTVTITTRTVAGTSKPVVQTVTTTTRTMTSTTESHPQ